MQQINVDKNITLTLTPQELMMVLSYLKRGIYSEVVEVVQAIEAQVVKQIQE